MNNQAKVRNPAMDVIRCFALFTVVSVHFFLNSGFYNTVVDCPRMYIMVAMRTFFMICVPLFLVLSGYLLKSKKPTLKYYSKLFYTIGIYVLASIACAVYKYIQSPETFSVMGQIWGLFNFSTANYSWYVEMYIGLFLLIPFLNVAYNNLESQKQKLLLIGTMLILTAIPHFINSFQLLNLEWWITPSSNNNFDFIFPDYWLSIYPITYYFIGCYLREYPIKITPIKNALLILGAFSVIGIYTIYRFRGDMPQWASWSSHGSIVTVIQTVLVFNFFLTLKYEKVGTGTQKFIGYVSKLTLGAYLCSWIFDDVFYRILNENVLDMHKRLDYFIIIVPAVYICSTALSALLNLAYDLIAKICNRLFKNKPVDKTTA